MADPADYLNFQRGDCALLAQAIAEHLGLPVYGVIDAHGDMNHVFAYDPETDTAYDSRGALALSEVPVGMQGTPPFTYREASVEEIEDLFGTYDEDECAYAEEIACEYA